MDAANDTTSGERVRARYRAALDRGELQPNPAQASLIERLAELADGLADYVPPAPRAGWRRSWRGRQEPPAGLYIYGPVGRGKSMLMDLFFAATAVPARRRIHFYAFMLEVHARLNAQRRDGTTEEPLAASPIA